MASASFLIKEIERNSLRESSNPKRSFQAVYSGKCSQSEYKRHRLVTSFELLPKGPLKTRAGLLESYIFTRELALERLRAAPDENLFIAKLNLQRLALECGMVSKSGKKVNFTQVNN